MAAFSEFLAARVNQEVVVGGLQVLGGRVSSNPLAF
jgi:hypothetical protein